MRRHGYILSHIAPMTLALIATTACEHKPLWMPETPIEPTEVEYDWPECRDAVTPGMTPNIHPYAKMNIKACEYNISLQATSP